MKRFCTTMWPTPRISNNNAFHSFKRIYSGIPDYSVPTDLDSYCKLCPAVLIVDSCFCVQNSNCSMELDIEDSMCTITWPLFDVEFDKMFEELLFEEYCCNAICHFVYRLYRYLLTISVISLLKKFKENTVSYHTVWTGY